MDADRPEPDMDMLRRLYDFGGLMVYRVVRFDPARFEIVKGKATFSEEAAQAEFDELTHAGFTATIESFIVKFNGAFSKKPNG